MRSARFAVLGAAIAIFTLAACGGGGGGGSQPIVDTSAIIDASGGKAVNIPSSQIVSGLEQRLARADSFLLTDVFDDAGFRDAATCRGGICNVAGTSYYISDVDLTGTYEAIMARHGYTVGQGRSSSEDVASDVYGAWADHSFFFIGFDSYLAEGEVYDTDLYGASIGTSTGSVPVSGSASWVGVVVAADLGRGEGHQGDATLTADFAAGDLDVAFTNMHDVETGAARASIHFSGVPMAGEGFAQRTAGRRIEGTFYGAGHVEAGGIFESGSAIGAFGAKRQ